MTYRCYRLPLLAAGVGVLCSLLLAAPADGQPLDQKVLRIGTSSTLTADATGAKEKAASASLRAFIKEETGLENEIVPVKDWRELSEKIEKGKLQLGVLAGYEFAWAQEEHNKLKPLALAVNVHRYPVAYVVTRKDGKAMKLNDLQGQGIAVPGSEQPFVRLFLEREAKLAGKKMDTFYAKITNPPNIEDALDDVVDGTIQAAAVDRAALDSYKRRKPGRFAQLKEVAHSPPFPPTVAAYQDGSLDQKTLAQFRSGLVNANRKEKGQMLLTMFKLTAFEPVPKDFDRVLAETRKAFPPEDSR
ncbi:MAG: phosphate/phosphite/phosphonate ABC transporter substrate-binding protein [Gemmataceae bacterium]|nr:phosphate/phosphite/phosphonate ABC transporter substrate-binding protein [Gemmataceae bacterium]